MPEITTSTTRLRLLLVVWTVVSVPILWSAVGHMTGAWVPDGDDAAIAHRTMQVFTTDPPLIGHESTADVAYEEQSPNHLGPVGYYVLAVPYAVSGWSPIGLAAGAAVVSLAAVGACLGLAQRTAGRCGLVAVGLGLALLSVRLGQNWLVRPHNAAIVAFPLVATLLGAWAYLRRDRAGLAVVLLAGSFCLQASLETLPVVGLTGLACLALAGYRRVILGGRMHRTRAWWAVAVALALLWLPPVVDVFVRWPGNLIVVGRYLLGQVGLIHHRSVKPGRLGIGPAAGSVLTYLTSLPGTDHRDFADDLQVLVPLGHLSLVHLAVGGCILGSAAAWAIVRGSAALRSLVLVAALALAVTPVGLAARPGPELATQTYFVIWVQAIVALAWMAVALAALEAAAPAVRGVVARGGASSRLVHVPAMASVAVVGLLAVVVAPRGEPVVRQPSRQITALSSQVRAHVPRGTYLIVGEGFSSWMSVSKGVGTDLLAHGYDIRFEDLDEMEDEPRFRGTDQMARLIVTDRLPDAPGPDLVARYAERGGATFLVRLVRGGSSANWCAGVGSLAYRIRGITGASATEGPLDPISTGSMWIDVLREVDPGELADARPGSPEASAVETLSGDVEATARWIALGAMDVPDDDQVAALRVVLRSFDASCSAGHVPGVTTVGTPPKDRRPPG